MNPFTKDYAGKPAVIRQFTFDCSIGIVPVDKKKILAARGDYFLLEG